MKTINELLIVTILLFSTSSLAGDLFDSTLGNNKQCDILKNNALENNWHYTGEDDALKYNVFQDRWDYAHEEDTVKYNTFENEWDLRSRVIA
jgi:hypothetical protein